MSRILIIVLFLISSVALAAKPNVLFIVCDDLDDYVQGFGGHPQAQTPHIERLGASGVRFTQAHCSIPICGPSRASFATCSLAPTMRLRSRP
jgi:arylsulfatase A-like enzyme